jgi:hypothetical protein
MKIYILSAIAVVVVIAGLMFGIPAYSRYQARADANNQTTLNEIAINQQDQLIQVETKKAAIRVADAQGIDQSQKIIASSLTSAYLQYLAIQAQQAMAQGTNHTEIYIPVGTNGIPLVVTANPNNTANSTPNAAN